MYIMKASAGPANRSTACPGSSSFLPSWLKRRNQEVFDLRLEEPTDRDGRNQPDDRTQQTRTELAEMLEERHLLVLLGDRWQLGLRDLDLLGRHGCFASAGSSASTAGSGSSVAGSDGTALAAPVSEADLVASTLGAGGGASS